MHIDKLEVKGFGKLTGRTVFLKKGINVIYGHNEMGKTTLQWFIKGMLYGLKSSRLSRNGLMPPQKRFEPWEGGHFGGALIYTLDDGSTCRVERNFESGAVQLFDSNFNNITGSFDIGKDKMPLFAERQMGIDEATFERTVLIRQLEIRLDEDGTAALAGKLANASSTGFEEISFSRAEKALTEALRYNVGTGRTTTQPLDKLETRLKQLDAERDRLQRQQKQRQSVREEQLELRNRRSRIEVESHFLEHIGKLVELRKTLDINLKKEAGLKEAVRHLKELEEALPCMENGEGRSASQDAYDGKALKQNAGTSERKAPQQNAGDYKGKAPQQNAGVYSGRRTTRSRLKWNIAWKLCMTIAALFAVLLGVDVLAQGIVSSWNGILVYSIGLLSAGTAGILAFRKARLHQNTMAASAASASTTAGNSAAAAARVAEIKVLVKNICRSASLLYDRQLNESYSVKQALSEVAAKLEELSEKLEQGIHEATIMECNAAGYFNIEDLDMVFYDSSSTHLEEIWRGEMDSVKKDILDISLKEKYVEGFLEDDQGDSDALQHVEEETVAVKEKITYLKYKGNALKLAHETLLQVGLEIQRTFAPDLDSRLSSIITGLTAGRYVDLRGDDRLALKVAVPESGDIKNALILSGAATDQMYLALRLAMADLLTAGGESLPLIMDEVFAQFDDNRTGLALKYLHNAYENKQVLIFTCKKREVELAREICGSNLNLVEL